MPTFNMFVGSDNETGYLDIERIANIVGKSHDFTMVPARGSWQGEREDSVIVTVSDNERNVLETVAALKIELNQDAIGIQRIPDITFL